jgi:hypothetical protein
VGIGQIAARINIALTIRGEFAFCGISQHADEKKPDLVTEARLFRLP